MPWDIKNISHHKCVTNFVFLQISGPPMWYTLKHRSHESEDNFDCHRGTFAAPEGNRSLATTHIYDKRWVQNIKFFLTAVFGGNLR